MKRTELTKNLSSVESNSPRADICRTLIGALILAGLAFHATALAAGLVVVDNQPLVVDAAANTASGWVLLQNTSAESSNFMLSAGSFVSGATTQALSARISLQTSGAPYLKVNLAPTSSLPVKVEVSNFLEGSEATSTLSANGGFLTTLRAERLGAPFNVTLDGVPVERPEIALKRGADLAFILRNVDPIPYRVRWELEVSGWLVTNGTAMVTPLSTARIPFQPKGGFFKWGLCVWMKDELKDGRLILRWDDSGGKPMREKVLPLRARITHVGDGLHAVGFILLMVVLSLGAVCSLWLNNAVPNQTKRLDLKDELEALTKRIHELTPQIGSKVRVLLRVERSRYLKMLEERWAISPDLVNVFKNVSAGVAVLKRQVDVLERVDEVYDEVERLRRRVVPATLLKEVLQRLEQACKLVGASSPPEADLAAAQTLVIEAAGWLRDIDKANDLIALKLAKRVKDVRKFFMPPQRRGQPFLRGTR